jgi:molecular chaperone HscB
MQAALTESRTCWRCHTDAADVLVCPGCEAPQPLARDTDLFRVLGLPRSLVIHAADLERRYHAASRAVHPDRHQAAGPQAGTLAVTASAAVNRAYRTLRDPVARARYWLELHGMRLGDDNNRVPPALAALVFETQEKLEELAGARRVLAIRQEVDAVRVDIRDRVTASEQELVAQGAAWERDGVAAAPATLADLKRRLSEISYLRSLLGDIDAALGA